jgi:pyruvate-ferredoxin/flavodoxin oxidoreductase
MEQHLRGIFSEAMETDNVAGMLDEAIAKTLANKELSDDERSGLEQEFGLFKEELNGFQFALTRPYYTNHESKTPGSGGLLSITVNPYTCKGCMECVAVCNDDALRPVMQTKQSVETLRRNWDFWMDLPNTPKRFIRVDDLEEGIGALETILLNKDNYLAFGSGDGACLGCGEKSVIHLFAATVEALMQPRVERHVAYLTELIEKLKRHIQLEITKVINVGNTESFTEALSKVGTGDVTLASIATKVEEMSGGEPIDQDWLRRVTGLVTSLKMLKWRYTAGITGNGRAKMGILNATGCSSVWGSTYPLNPYPVPWANHLFQDPASLAMGIFEGHMAKMAEGFKAIRMAELELSGKYNPVEHEEFLTYFNWHQFTDEEWELCPPVVAIGGDGAMYDIGFQNLSRALMSGKPIKVLVLDTQVYSNTGGQACTSGFFGQVSDMAQYGKAIKGKEEIRKEMGLIGMAHRTTYVLQSAISNANHMIEGFIQGLKARRPALFNIYTSCQPEHGIGDDKSHDQAKLAVESRAYPLFKYNPDLGTRPEECFDLDGNPAADQLWPTYTLNYKEGLRDKSMVLPLTFGDFALTEIRFRKHFRIAPPDTWNENMVPLAEFIELPEDEREGCFPYVWTVDRKNQLTRLLVAAPIVHACEERRDFWIMLRSIARVADEQPSESEIADRVRGELTRRLAAGLMQLMGGDAVHAAAALTQGEVAVTEETSGVNGNYQAPWIDSPQCTSCDECININPNIFVYNESKKATIKDPLGGPYKDLVKAAERCTAQVIHPGLPKDHNEKGVEKLIARARKFN